MAGNQKTIYVYEHFSGEDPQFIGTLFVDHIRARQFERDEFGLEQKWINQLIKPGSSLGGARPKATAAAFPDV